MVGNDVVTNNGILRLVINLDRSPERMRSISQQLVVRDLHFERLPAVDGRKLAQEELSRLEAPYDAPEKFVFRRRCGQMEKRVFCRIRPVGRSSSKAAVNGGLIMEDDIVLSPRFKLFATSSEWIPEGVRVIQLHGSHQSFAVGESYPVRDTELCRILNPTPLCSFAYLMHREAAAYALASYIPISAPVDDWLFCPYSDFAKRFPPHRLLSACVASLGAPSDIGARATRQRLPNSVKVRLLRGAKSGAYRLSMLFRKKVFLTFGYD